MKNQKSGGPVGQTPVLCRPSAHPSEYLNPALVHHRHILYPLPLPVLPEPLGSLGRGHRLFLHLGLLGDAEHKLLHIGKSLVIAQDIPIALPADIFHQVF